MRHTPWTKAGHSIVLSNLALPGLWTDFKVLRMCLFKRKEGVYGKSACQKKRDFLCVSVKHNDEWNTLSTIQETHILNGPLGWHLFLGWDGLSSFVWEEARCWLLYFLLPASQLGRRTQAVFLVFSQSHWELRYWCWLRAGSLKTCLAFLHLSWP